jgi:hypothetical protein
MPRPEERERVDPVRTLRLDRVLPVTELPVVTATLPLRALLTDGADDADGADRPAAGALGRDTGGDPHVEQ